MNAAIEGEQGFAEIEFAMSRTPKKKKSFFHLFSILYFFFLMYFISPREISFRMIETTSCQACRHKGRYTKLFLFFSGRIASQVKRQKSMILIPQKTLSDNIHYRYLRESVQLSNDNHRDVPQSVHTCSLTFNL